VIGLYTPAVEQRSELRRVVRALIERQCRLANSANLAMRFRTLWVEALLDESLSDCTDHDIGGLLAIVQERFAIFEPAFAVCYHARQRLMLGSAKERLTQ
jgi:hypothetical protein